jgi:hypothetical protein
VKASCGQAVTPSVVARVAIRWLMTDKVADDASSGEVVLAILLLRVGVQGQLALRVETGAPPEPSRVHSSGARF